MSEWIDFQDAQPLVGQEVEIKALGKIISAFAIGDGRYVDRTGCEYRGGGRWRPIPKHDWISVEDELPGYGRKCLINASSGIEIAEVISVDDGIWEWKTQLGKRINSGCIRHWMPLPDPPEHFRPCPFCGNRFIKAKKVYVASGLYYASECMSCEACGPSAKTPEEAKAKWNQIGQGSTKET